MIVRDETTVRLEIDNKFAYIDGKGTLLETAPFLDEKSQSTYVPLRFISETIGAKVGWIAEDNTVTIDMK